MQARRGSLSCLPRAQRVYALLHATPRRNLLQSVSCRMCVIEYLYRFRGSISLLAAQPDSCRVLLRYEKNSRLLTSVPQPERTDISATAKKTRSCRMRLTLELRFGNRFVDGREQFVAHRLRFQQV